MDFYKRKIDALQRIDQLVADKMSLERIYMKIETEYGFGEKVVDKRIERLKRCTSQK